PCASSTRLSGAARSACSIRATARSWPISASTRMTSSSALPICRGPHKRSSSTFAWKGMVPLELSGRSPFPPIGDLPYLVTLPAFGFYWFQLTEETEAPHWHQQVPDMLPEFITLTTRDGSIENALAGREGRQFEAEALPRYLELQRWFGAKDQTIESAKLEPVAEMPDARFQLA